MALSHRTFAAALRAAASDNKVVPERLRPLLEKAAKHIDDLQDVVEQLQNDRISRLGGIGSPQ